MVETVEPQEPLSFLSDSDAYSNRLRPKPQDYLLSKILDDEESDMPEGMIDDPIAKLLLGM